MTTRPILVCSKGRPENCPTIRRLIGYGDVIEWRIILEPQDINSYVSAGVPPQKIIPLPENNKGIGYARGRALEQARKIYSGWVWMLDDDVSNWYKVVGKKCFSGQDMLETLSAAEKHFLSDPSAAQAALEYNQIAWAARKPYIRGSYCDVVVAFHLERTRCVSHRESLPLKEDRDYTMQILAAGYTTIRVTEYAFSCPSMGSNKGGLHGVYSAPSRIEESCTMMEKLWGPDLAKKVRKKNGVVDVKINWKALRPVV